MAYDVRTSTGCLGKKSGVEVELHEKQCNAAADRNEECGACACAG
jgi:hypothetical protein